MELTPRLRLMNWLVRQGLTGLPGNDLIRGFCERCRAGGVELSRGLVFIDTGGGQPSTTSWKTAWTNW